MARRSVAGALVLIGILLAGWLPAREPDRAQTATGTVAKIEATQRSVTVTLPDGSQERFFWTNDTKFSGVLAPEARVTIRYAVSPDGKNLAQQISVSRG
jgi:hypothetical protein